MELKINFTDGTKNFISVVNHEDIERIKESIDGTYVRKNKWIGIDGFYINLDNVTYIKMEDD